jgi:hypothetical protein
MSGDAISMTETISNVNAASILFLGHNSEWWDSWLIVSGFLVALTAAAAGVAGFGAIVSHQREATAAEEALERYKLETAKELAEATARQKEAELQILQLRLPRSLDIVKFEATVKKLPPPMSYEVLYDANAPDASSLAGLIWGIFFNAKWPTQQTTGAAPLKAPRRTYCRMQTCRGPKLPVADLGAYLWLPPLDQILIKILWQLDLPKHWASPLRGRRPS